MEMEFALFPEKNWSLREELAENCNILDLHLRDFVAHLPLLALIDLGLGLAAKSTPAKSHQAKSNQPSPIKVLPNVVPNLVHCSEAGSIDYLFHQLYNYPFMEMVSHVLYLCLLA